MRHFNNLIFRKKLLYSIMALALVLGGGATIFLPLEVSGLEAAEVGDAAVPTDPLPGLLG